MKIIDLHNHTKYSYDGQNSTREVIENAIKNGVDILGITDHQFSIQENITRYIAEIKGLKKEFSDRITVLCGLEIGTRPKPDDFMPILSKELDFCLFESLDSSRAVDLYEFLEWRRLFLCPTGLAHTDIFALSKRYDVNFLAVMKRENIFWEINCSGNYDYYFDIISNKEKQEMVRNSGISVSVGSDTHWIGDYNIKKVIQTNEFIKKLGNPILF